MKKFAIFSRAKDSVKKMDSVSKETLKSGTTMKEQILKAAGRQSISVAMLILCGLGVAEVGGDLVAMEFNKAAKKNVQENYPLLLPYMYFVGALMCAIAIDEMLNKKRHKEIAIEKLLMDTNLYIDDKHCALVFGLLTNYMTYGEYTKIQTIIKDWQTTKIKSGYELDAIFEYSAKISDILNNVMDRTVGLRETLHKIANGKDGANIALFQQEANKIYAKNHYVSDR